MDDKKIKPEILAKARKLAEKELLNIRLKELRDKSGIKQADVANFSSSTNIPIIVSIVSSDQIMLWYLHIDFTGDCFTLGFQGIF